MFSRSSRIEGSQLEDRTIDKMWLVRHLELIRQNLVGDLRVVKVRQGMVKGKTELGFHNKT